MKTLIKVALISLLWCAAINSGDLGSIDTELRLHMAHAWWTGTEEVSPDYKPKTRIDLKVGVLGVEGKRYIAYDVGQSMLMLPGDWLATQLQRWIPWLSTTWIVIFLILIPLNVAAVVSCFWLLKLFGFEEQIAGLATIAWFLGTTVLNYAQIHFQNNQLLLFVTIGYAAALSFVQRGKPLFALLSGLALGSALLIRTTSVIHVLTVIMFLVGCIAYQNRNKLKVFQEIFKGVGLWIVGFIPLALFGRILDYIRYGSFLATGQNIQVQQFTTDPIFTELPQLPSNYPFIYSPDVGILGVLFSPAKSIFIYDPLLLPCLVLTIVFWKRLSPYMQWYVVTGLFNLGLHMILTSKFDFWHGDWAWAARYHVTSVHLLLIPLVALFIQNILSAKSWASWLMRCILSLAILVQIASVTMPLGAEIYPEEFQTRFGLNDYRLEFRLGQRITNIICLANHSFSEHCLHKLAPTLSPEKRMIIERYYNKLAFLPFTQSFRRRGLVILVWGIVLSLAIWTTWQFCFWKSVL